MTFINRSFSLLELIVLLFQIQFEEHKVLSVSIKCFSLSSFKIVKLTVEVSCWSYSCSFKSESLFFPSFSLYVCFVVVFLCCFVFLLKNVVSFPFFLCEVSHAIFFLVLLLLWEWRITQEFLEKEYQGGPVIKNLCAGISAVLFSRHGVTSHLLAT